MDKTPLLLFGPIMTAIGLYFRYRRKNIREWMNARRLDNAKDTSLEICSFCGSPMGEPFKHQSPKGLLTAAKCSRYPDCRHIEWKT